MNRVMAEINISPLSNPDPAPNLIDNRKNTISAEVKGRMPDVSKESDKNVEVSSSSRLNTAIKDDEDVQPQVNASGQDRMLLKPNKILPCPRCNSLNTKFCYFNNHNVNQPRHFCKNCQRYWTSGGSMRNVPVGAGKRKTKHSLQQPTHSTCTSSSCSVESPVSNLEGHVKRTENNDEPLGSSLVTPNCAKNDFLKVEPDKEQTMHPLQGFPGPPWPYSWGPVPWIPPMILAAPALCAAPVPFPFMPASFWPCISSWPNESWRTSETLGKHSRDGVSKDEEKEKKLLWIPKTLRIDDPEEAAKSSIWSTLGIKREETVKRGSLFRGFQSSDESSGCNAINACNILHANPAASARSQTFQESA